MMLTHNFIDLSTELTNSCIKSSLICKIFKLYEFASAYENVGNVSGYPTDGNTNINLTHWL